MNKSIPDSLRAHYLLLCESLIDQASKMRNFAMKPGNAWLAQAELANISQTLGEIDSLLAQIKAADEN